MNPTSYLDLAKDLVVRVKRGDALPGTAGEAECRSAISRAYYAAFQVAADFYGTLGIDVPESGKCHVVVKDGLNNSGQANLESASSQLGTLYSERRRADYKLNDVRSEKLSQADSMTALSEQIIKVLRQVNSECKNDQQKKAAVAGAILGWAKISAQPLYPKK